MNIYEKLTKIQEELKVPKIRVNSFAKFKYRNLEDILESLKPLFQKTKTTLIISDEIIYLEGRFYVKATATLVDSEKSEDRIVVSALSREDEVKKGMDVSQVTGSVSSYARKYCLNGLFAIDDTKDADNHDNTEETKPAKKKDSKNTNVKFLEKMQEFKDVMKVEDFQKILKDFGYADVKFINSHEEQVKVFIKLKEAVDLKATE